MGIICILGALETEKLSTVQSRQNFRRAHDFLGPKTPFIGYYIGIYRDIQGLGYGHVGPAAQKKLRVRNQNLRLAWYLSGSEVRRFGDHIFYFMLYMYILS